MWLRRYNVFHQIAKKKESVSSINISPQEPTKKPLATNISDEHMSEHYQRQCERNDFKVTGVSVFVYTVIFFKISTQKKNVWKKEKVNHGDLHKGTVCLNSRERTVSKTWTSHEDEMLYTFMIFNFFPPMHYPAVRKICKDLKGFAYYF